MKCGEQIRFLAFANDVEFLDQENYISVVALIESWEEMLEIIDMWQEYIYYFTTIYNW